MINDRLQTDREALLAELRTAGAKVVSPTSVVCPFHDDRSPSMTVYQSDDGIWRAKCCTTSCGFIGDLFDVRARATNTSLEDVLRAVGDKPKPKVQGARRYGTLDAMREQLRATDVYRYTDLNGNVDLAVLRIDTPNGKKSFRQARRLPSGEWIMKRPDPPLPIYNRTRVAGADEVLVVEGEKCVHALNRAGRVATTSPGGAGKAALADWSPLAGKRVVLWPDNDPPGIKHMRDVAELLDAIEPRPSVRMINVERVEALAAKDDAADIVERTPTEIVGDALDDIIDDAEPLSVLAGLDGRVQAMIEGRRRAEPWPWGTLTRMTKALLPGTTTMLCGPGGASKSFLVLQAAAYWLEQDLPVAMLLLEDDREYHLQRSFAQLAGEQGLVDDDWLSANNAGRVEELRAQQGDKLERLARSMRGNYEDRMMTYDEILDWMRDRIRAGTRLIVIDPVTIAQPNSKPWVADQDFIEKAKRLLVEGRASALMVTHPKKGAGRGGSLDDLAGGAAWPRFAHTVLWLRSNYPPKSYEVRTEDRTVGRMDVEANRIIEITKARNGRGTGASIAYSFDAPTLRFIEWGLIIKENKQ